MANEITISASLAFAKGSVKISAVKSGLKRDVDGTEYVRASQVVGTAAEPLAVNDVEALGYTLIENLSTTATVHIRAGTAGDDLVRILPGDIVLFRLASDADPHLIASAADTRVQVLLLEE